MTLSKSFNSLLTKSFSNIKYFPLTYVFYAANGSVTSKNNFSFSYNNLACKSTIFKPFNIICLILENKPSLS